MDLDAAGPRRLDCTEEPIGATPAVDTGQLQMRDLHVNTAAFADIDRLGHRFEHIVRLISDMGGIARTMLLQHAAECADFLGLGVQAGRREQPRRHTERAGG